MKKIARWLYLRTHAQEVEAARAFLFRVTEGKAGYKIAMETSGAVQVLKILNLIENDD